MAKFTLTFKTPDVMEPLKEVAERELGGDWSTPYRDLKYAVEDKVNELEKFLSKWVKYGEYVTIEFDTLAYTAKVV